MAWYPKPSKNGQAPIPKSKQADGGGATRPRLQAKPLNSPQYTAVLEHADCEVEAIDGYARQAARCQHQTDLHPSWPARKRSARCTPNSGLIAIVSCHVQVPFSFTSLRQTHALLPERASFGSCDAVCRWRTHIDPAATTMQAPEPSCRWVQTLPTARRTVTAPSSS